MTNQKLLMFAVAGLLVPAADAAAQTSSVKAPKTSMIIPHPVQDLAPVSGTPARLRRTNEEQAGTEDTTFVLLGDGKQGLYFSYSTELPPIADGQPVRPANRRVQLAMVPFTLSADATGIAATPDMAKAKWVTNNNANEYRSANVPAAFALNQNIGCVQYNWQPAGTNDTKLYMQCFDAAGNNVMPQTEAFAKNNDDVCGSIEGNIPSFIGKTGNTSRYISWCLANGNGSDNAWARVFQLTESGTAVTYKREFDLTILQEEERSRGMCSVDPSGTYAVCAGTEGNNQPQRQGTWMAAVDLTPGKYNGPNQQGALLWKKQIGGRTTVDGKRTYSMRAMINRVMTADAQGNLVPTDMLFWRDGLLQGNNNTNGKGGTYRANMFAVVKTTRTGFEFVTPRTDLATTELFGVDGTHNIQTAIVVGSGADLKPALLIHNGSHTGGQGTSQLRAIGWDQATGKFSSLGQFAGAPHDRHLYPNYLGNNPGNQGRGHAFNQLIANPFFGEGGNNDKYLVVSSTAAKGAEMDPRKKLAGYLSVMTVATGPVAAPAPAAPAPAPAPGSSGGETTDETADETVDGSDTTLGGCSTGGSAGFATFLLIGLAAFIRRRR